MKMGQTIGVWFGLSFCAIQFAAAGTLKLAADSGSQHVFFGASRKISMVFRNPSDQDFEGEIRARMFQASSGTTIKLGEKNWKTLHVLPQQTVLESAHLDFPLVKARTKFLVQWLEDENQIIGTSEVWVYPTNLLTELKLVMNRRSLGLFDPLNQLKPLVSNLKQEFVDLENVELENFSGNLAIFGPFDSARQMGADLEDSVRALAGKNVAVVWLQPPGQQKELLPSFYAVPKKDVAVIVVQPDLVSDLRENPRAQLNLIHFCKMALMPKPLTLPDSTLGQNGPRI